MSLQHPSLINGLVSLSLVILMLAYPFLVYHYIEVLSPRLFGGVLLVVFVLRFLVTGNTKRVKDWIMLTAVAGFCFAIMLVDSAQLLKFYPVLMNTGMGLVFLTSLTDRECLIETFAKLGGKTPPAKAQGYLRRLTLLWGILLLINAAVSAYTAWYTSLQFWTLYNGLLSYLLLLGFAVIEWFYRGYYKKKHNIIDE